MSAGFKFTAASTDSTSTNGGLSVINTASKPETGGFKLPVPASAASTEAPRVVPAAMMSGTSAKKVPEAGIKFGGLNSTAALPVGIKFGTYSDNQTDLPLGSEGSQASEAPKADTIVGGFKFGNTDSKSSEGGLVSSEKKGVGGFKFGSQSSEKKETVPTGGKVGAPGMGGFKFGPTENENVSGLKFGTQATAAAGSSASDKPAIGGFKFETSGTENKTPGGFKFGSVDNSSVSRLSKVSQSIGGVVNSASTVTSLASTSASTLFTSPVSTSNQASKNSVTSIGGFQFGAPNQVQTGSAPQNVDSGISSLNSLPKSNATSIFGGSGSIMTGSGATSGPAPPKYEAANTTLNPSSVFTFGANTNTSTGVSATPTGTGAKSGMAFGTAGQAATVSKPQSGFSFPTVASTAPPAATGIFTFGSGPKQSDASKPLGAGAPAPQPFGLGKRMGGEDGGSAVKQTGSAFKFGGGNNPAVPAFGASATAAPPAFGGFVGANNATVASSSSSSSMFAAAPASSVPAFGSTAATTQALPAFGAPQPAAPTPFNAQPLATPNTGFNNTNPPNQTFNTTPSFNFGAPTKAAVFQFGGDGNNSSGANNSAPFAFGAQSAAPQPQASSGFNFGTAPQPQLPAMNFSAGATPSGPTPLATSNPFSVSTPPARQTGQRQVRKAVRKLRK